VEHARWWNQAPHAAVTIARTTTSRGLTTQNKLLHQTEGQRTYAVVPETGDEVMDSLQRFVAAERIGAAQLTATGALSDLTLMYFDWEKKDYQRIPVRDQETRCSNRERVDHSGSR
jgi:hypothetical protein